MSPRLAGAVLALIAAALLAISVATSAWWAGHPSVEGRTIEAKTVHVGLHGAEGCNTGGDGGCTTLELPDAFTLTGYVAAGATGLLALAAILLAIATLQLAAVRKTLSTVVFVLVAVAVLVAAALIVQGPKVGKVSQHVVIPMGYGLFVFVGGVVSAIVASVLARRPAPKVELRPSRAAVAPALAAPPPQQPVDVLAFLKEEAPRPTAPATHSPLAGPAGPLAPQSPQFSNGPIPTPVPVAPPMPMPMPSSGVLEGRTKPASIAPPPPRPSPPAPPRTNPPSTPPRTKPVSVPPPPSAPVFGTSEPPRTHPVSVPPPPGARTRAGTAPPPPGAISARLKASSVPPPVRPGALPRPPDPTVLPVATPTTPKTLAGAVAPPTISTPKPVVAAKLPVRAETDPSELAETVDRDNHSVGDATDASVVLPPESEHTSPSEPLDTEEAPAVRPPADTDAVATIAIPKEDPVEAEIARQSMSEIATVARERISSRELMTGDSTSETAAAAAAAEPAAAPAAAATKIPLTTASSTLPPPNEKQVATSGPSPACPQCEAPMAWVEEHLRFYCKSCRMYF
jgi:hypothetical protein